MGVRVAVLIKHFTHIQGAQIVGTEPFRRLGTARCEAVHQPIPQAFEALVGVGLSFQRGEQENAGDVALDCANLGHNFAQGGALRHMQSLLPKVAGFFVGAIAFPSR